MSRYLGRGQKPEKHREFYPCIEGGSIHPSGRGIREATWLPQGEPDFSFKPLR